MRRTKNANSHKVGAISRCLRKISQSPRFTREMDPERPLKPEPGSENPAPNRVSAGAGAAAGMGLTFAISVVMFLLAGQWIDRKLGTEPLFLIVFVFVGAGASFNSNYRKLTAQQRDDA